MRSEINGILAGYAFRRREGKARARHTQSSMKQAKSIHNNNDTHNNYTAKARAKEHYRGQCVT